MEMCQICRRNCDLYWQVCWVVEVITCHTVGRCTSHYANRTYWLLFLSSLPLQLTFLILSLYLFEKFQRLCSLLQSFHPATITTPDIVQTTKTPPTGETLRGRTTIDTNRTIQNRPTITVRRPTIGDRYPDRTRTIRGAPAGRAMKGIVPRGRRVRGTLSTASRMSARSWLELTIPVCCFTSIVYITSIVYSVDFFSFTSSCSFVMFYLCKREISTITLHNFLNNCSCRNSELPVTILWLWLLVIQGNRITTLINHFLDPFKNTRANSKESLMVTSKWNAVKPPESWGN